jgi:hypothetical protein
MRCTLTIIRFVLYYYTGNTEIMQVQGKIGLILLRNGSFLQAFFHIQKKSVKSAREKNRKNH